jgi:DNA-binding response OmpR family regulator
MTKSVMSQSSLNFSHLAVNSQKKDRPMADMVLLIEDSATFRALLSSMLTTQGYSVITAENGKSGILKASAERPNAIILDLSLPDVTGADVLSSLKSNAKTGQIPVIICTASVDGELRDEVVKRGADEIFTKPVTPKDLISALRRHTDRGNRAENSQAQAPGLCVR